MVVESSLRKNDIGNVVYQKNYYIEYLDNCGQNKISKSAKDLEVFFCPFLQETNFRNKQSMVQYPRSYQRDRWIIEKEQNTNHTQVRMICISKTNLIFFYGRCKVVHHAYFAGPIGDCCIIFEPRLNEYVMGCASLLRTHGTSRR